MYRDRTSLWAGTIFIILGFLFLLEKLGILVISSAYIWPALLIVMGAAVLAGSSRRRSQGP